MSSEMQDSIQEIARTAQRAAAACAGLDPRGAAKRLAEAGVLGVLAPEEVGGLALPLAAAGAVAAAAEAELLGFPLAETMLAARLLAGPKPELAAALVAGEAVLSIAWAGALAGGAAGLSGSLSRIPCGVAADWLLAPLQGGGAALLATTAKGVLVAEEPGLDLERPAGRATVEGAAAELLPAAAMATLLADAQILRAAECLGGAEAAMERAIAHVTQRKQFGRLLVANQGLRFELARHKILLEGGRQVLGHALAVAPQDAAGHALARLVCRAQVPEAAIAIIEGAVQLHGGMGFTWDVPVHRHLRRARTAAAQCAPVQAREALAARIDEADDAEPWAA